MEQKLNPFFLRCTKIMLKELDKNGYVIVKRERLDQLIKLENNVREYAHRLQKTARRCE